MAQKDEYLICKINGTPKTFLMKVSAVQSGTIHGFLAHDYHVPGKRVAVEVVPKDVILNLGADPRPGKVYGVEVLRPVGSKDSPDFGKVTFFYKPSKDVGANLMDAFDKVAKIFKRQRLEFALGDGIWEVMAPQGSKSGMYKRSRKPDLNPHRFLIHPELLPATEYPYVIAHELAHHLHLEFMDNPKLNASWIRLFNTSIRPTSVSKEKSMELLKAMETHDGPPSSLGSVLSEEDTRAFRQILRAIQQYRAVSVKELDTLAESDDMDEVQGLWPKRAIPHKELEPVVSEYATRSYRELVAESISFYLVGKKLPKEVTALVERSLTYARKVGSRGA